MQKENIINDILIYRNFEYTTTYKNPQKLLIIFKIINFLEQLNCMNSYISINNYTSKTNLWDDTYLLLQ